MDPILATIVGYLPTAAGGILGVCGHVLKKVIQQRDTDSSFSLHEYLSRYPYKTVLTVFYMIAGIAGLAAAGEVSFYSALVTGFAANSLSGAADK